MKNSSQRNNSQNLAEYLRSFPLKEGENKTAVPYFNIYRFTSKKIQMPQTDDPYLYVVADGSMRLYTPSGIMDYPAGQYSISEIDTPLFGHVLTFSDKGDFLAMSLGFTVNDVITVVLDLDDDLAEQILASKLSASDMPASDKRVINSVIRLLSVLGEKTQLTFMANHIRREIIFYMLCGSCGKQFLTSIINVRQAGEILHKQASRRKNSLLK